MQFAERFATQFFGIEFEAAKRLAFAIRLALKKNSLRRILTSNMPGYFVISLRVILFLRIMLIGFKYRLIAYRLLYRRLYGLGYDGMGIKRDADFIDERY
jgi:hypothetical protein